MKRTLCCGLAVALIASAANAQDVAPKPIPATRPEAKQALEKLKLREARLPLPPPTEEELARRTEAPPAGSDRGW